MKQPLQLQYPKSTLERTNSYIMFRAYDYSSAPNSSRIVNIRSNIQRNSGNLTGATLTDLPETLGKSFTTSSGGADEGDATSIGSVSL